MSRLADMLANRPSSDVFSDVEIERILSLDLANPLSKEELEEMSRMFVQAKHFEEGYRLFDAQANGIYQYLAYGCLFAPIGVGWG